MKTGTSRASGVRQRNERDAELAAEPTGGEPRRLVLLAEDDEGIQWALSETLSEAGCEVIAVATVEELSAVLARLRPDVLLADYQLLDDTTEAVVTEVVTSSAVGTVVVISAAPAARTLAERLSVPHIGKPFELDEVIAIVAGARTVAA